MADGGRRLIIGVGNPQRGDDAVGRIVASRLRDSKEAAVRDMEIIEHDGEPAGLLEYMTDARLVYLVDAASSGARPGTIHRFDARHGPLPRHLFKLTTHDLGPGEAIELARAMQRLPQTCVIYAVEGTAFDPGSSALSAPVARAAAALVNRILGELAAPDADAS